MKSEEFPQWRKRKPNVLLIHYQSVFFITDNISMQYDSTNFMFVGIQLVYIRHEKLIVRTLIVLAEEKVQIVRLSRDLQMHLCNGLLLIRLLLHACISIRV